MKLFIKSLDENRPIDCPFMGIAWSGCNEELRDILKKYAVLNGKIIPFKVSVIESDIELIFHHEYSHPDALKKTDTFFLFENKKLIASGGKLSEIMDWYDKKNIHEQSYIES